MDTRRVILYAALALIVYSMWMSWQQDYPPLKPQAVTNNTQPGKENLLPDIKTVTTDLNNTPITEIANVEEQKELIKVNTDVLAIQINPLHGDIVSASLLKYPLSVAEKNTPTTLLNNNENQKYLANSSLLAKTKKRIDAIDFNYHSSQQSYTLKNGENDLVVTLIGQSKEGINVKKTFTFTKGSYLVKISYDLSNNSDKTWQGFMNTQLLRSSPDEDKSSIFHVGSYTGASYSNPGHHRYQKVNFKDMNKSNLEVEAKGGWIAMQQHYFLSAWVPDPDSKNTFYTRAVNDDFIIGSVSQPLLLEPGQSKKTGASLYIGPEVTSTLKEISPGLDLTVDYGWLWFLSSLLFSLMKAIHTIVGNWGWSIVLVTMLIKLAFYRLSATSYRSMAGMRKLQPKLQALRERYGDDKAKMSQATMELYRQEKVNPLGGCLPIIVQIPVFIALYWVLLESVELRQAPFIFWIKDLASADPYHILPIIMGGTMLIQQRLNPAPPDPMQAKIMMFLPILFTALFWNFPAGLVLYWIVNNTLSILQQWYITHKYSDDKISSKKVIVIKP